MRVNLLCVTLLGVAAAACGQDSSTGTRNYDGGFLACVAAAGATSSGGRFGTGGSFGAGGSGTGGGSVGYTGGTTSSGGVGGGSSNSGGINSGIGGSPVTGNCTVSLLGYAIVDAEYDLALDRMVVVSQGPDRLHIVDGVTKAESTVDLPRAPVAVSVAPDGATAAVAHDGFVSWVDLKALRVLKT